MKPQMSKSEKELRGDFDFSRAVRGKYAERYRQGHSITPLEGQPDEDDPLQPGGEDPQLTEIAGKHLLIAHLIEAGIEVAEPIRDNGIDLIAYRGAKGSEDFAAWPIQLKAFSHESFYLERKYASRPRLLIAYVWNVKTPGKSEIYALTYAEALRVMDDRGYSATDSWTRGNRYFVRDAGRELKDRLQEYKMTPEKWQEKLKVA